MKKWQHRTIQYFCFVVLLVNAIYLHIKGSSVFSSFILLWCLLVATYSIYEFRIAPNREQSGYFKGRVEGFENMQRLLNGYNTVKPLKAKTK